MTLHTAAWDKTREDTADMIDGEATSIALVASTEAPGADSDADRAANIRDEDIGNLDPEEVILARPEWGSVAMLASAASFDGAVPAAIAAANPNLFWNVERNGQFSISNGGGSLDETFNEMFGGPQKAGDDEDGDNDAWSDWVDAHQRRAEIQRQIEEDRAATLSEAQIDAIPWVGNPDEIYTFDGKSATRRQWLAGSRAARTKIREMLANGEITEAEAAHEDRLVSQNEVAIREGRLSDSVELRQEMQPWTRQVIDQHTRTTVDVDHAVSVSTSHAAVSAASDMSTSTTARDDALSQIDAADRRQPASRTTALVTTERESALSHPPSVQLTEKFATASSPNALAFASGGVQLSQPIPRHRQRRA